MPDDRWESLYESVEESCSGAVVDSPDFSSSDFRVVIIRAGVTKDRKREYTAEALRDAVRRGVYSKRRMFCDHRGPNDKARGHRSCRDLWARTGEAQFDEDTQSVVAPAHACSQEARVFLDDPVARRTVEFSHDAYIRYEVCPEPRPRGYIPRVAVIEECNSVDFVPFGNAGGRIAEAATEDDHADDEEFAMTDEINGAIEAAVTEGLGNALDKFFEPYMARLEVMFAQKPADDPAPADPSPEAAPADAKLDALLKENEQLKHEKAVAETGKIVAGVLDGLKLSATARTVVEAKFEGKSLPATEIEAAVKEAAEEAEALGRAFILEAQGGTRVKAIPHVSGAQNAFSPRIVDGSEVKPSDASLRHYLRSQGRDGRRIGEAIFSDGESE